MSALWEVKNVHIHVRTCLCVGGTLTKCPAIESLSVMSRCHGAKNFSSKQKNASLLEPLCRRGQVGNYRLEKQKESYNKVYLRLCSQ